MKKFYERFSEYIKENDIILGLSKREETSQLLNSKPEEMPIISIIPMTGKGIDAVVDDLAFCCNETKTVNRDSNQKDTQTLELKRKVKRI